MQALWISTCEFVSDMPDNYNLVLEAHSYVDDKNRYFKLTISGWSDKIDKFLSSAPIWGQFKSTAQLCYNASVICQSKKFTLSHATQVYACLVHLNHAVHLRISHSFIHNSAVKSVHATSKYYDDDAQNNYFHD